MKRINKQSIAKSFLLCLSWLITTLSSSQGAAGQSASENYILKRSYIDTQGRYTTTIQYFDGLGRPYRQVQKDAVSAGVDLVVATEYDSQGRDSLTWLPVKGRDGLPLTADEIRTQAAALYNSDSRPYSVSLYEPSALNRISKSFGPGQAWAAAGRASETAYMSNSTTDTRLVCRKYMAKDEKTLEKKGHYPAASLYVTEAKDEDGHTVLTFKNTIGQVLLTRTFPQANGAPADTYYVYDSHGMLCWVLPPAASDLLVSDGTWSWNDADISNYVYYYCYNGRQQLITKKLPGCEKVEIIYDLAGRIALIQDGNLRAKNRLQYFYYDTFGNTTEMGLCKLLSHQTLDYYRNYITANCYALTGSTVSDFVNSRKGIPVIENLEPLIKSYYDDYSFLSGPGFSSQSEFVAGAYSAKGRLTGCEMKVFGSDKPIRSVYHYDRKGRLCKTVSTNLLGGCNQEEQTYTFTGQIATKKLIHTSLYASPVTESYTYSYDKWGRLLTTTHKLNEHAPVTLAAYTYDAVGRRSKKTVNNGAYAATYSYNIRDWVEKIESPRFTQQLYYNTNTANPCYNGNISCIKWEAGLDEAFRGYKFFYDGADRLTSSVYGEGSDLLSNQGRYTENMSYDKMGNILSLQRYAGFSASVSGLIDDLRLSYSGNRLTKVTDLVTRAVPPDVMHFTDRVDAAVEYTYDANGNQVSDLNKNISQIEYNILNLPRSIRFTGSENSVSYLYSAAGTKLQVKHTAGAQDEVIDYCDNMVYKNGTLSKILIDEGYIAMEGSAPVYHYYVQDYQGNNRVVIDQNGSVNQVNHYYPSGTLIAESTGGGEQSYKYNAQELDSSFGLNHYDYGSRFYDPVIGRWSVPDKYAEKYYSLSPYQYAAANPIRNMDINGDSIFVNVDGTRYVYSEISDGKYGFVNGNGQIYDGDSKFVQSLSSSLATLMEGVNGKGVVDHVASNEKNVTIKEGKTNRATKIDDNTYEVSWGQDNPGNAPTTDNSNRPGYIGLIHELTHVRDYMDNKYNKSVWATLPNKKTVLQAEKSAVQMENLVRAEHGLGLRTHYAYYKASDGKYYGHEPTSAVTTYKNNAGKTIYRSMFDGKEIKIVNIKK